MKKKWTLILVLFLTTVSNATPFRHALNQFPEPDIQILAEINPGLAYLNPKYARLFDIKYMLQNQAPFLHPAVMNKTLSALACAEKNDINYNPVLTIIDYALPSNQKRIWVFDLIQMKLLYHTYVSHGINSGTLHTVYFSNRNNSKASSIGIYLTGPSYYGREGLSLRLTGLDRGFNHNAMRRYIVMHGGWYMAEPFIKKYGRPGRSWGCPALPKHEKEAIINTIKNDTFMVIYYPSDRWLTQSTFLNCALPIGLMVKDNQEYVIQSPRYQGDDRDAILFSDNNGNDRREQNEPIIVMKADDYIKTFQLQAPLKRMLRRRIDGKEYIALSPAEMDKYMDKEAAKEQNLADIYFVVPQVVKRRGVWKTFMKIVHQDEITEIKRLSEQRTQNYLIQFDKKTNLTFKPSQRFIRWLGL